MFLSVKKEMKSSTSNPARKKYQALMLDVDGTTIENRSDAMPSEKVKDAIRKANRIIKVGLATSRPFWHVKHIIEDLEINAPCIIIGGAQIYDPRVNKIIWEKFIETAAVKEIFKVAKKFKVAIADDGDGKYINNRKINIEDYKNKGPLQFWTPALDSKLAEEFAGELSKIPTITALRVPSWETRKNDVVISHSLATKQHGIIEVAKLLGISTKDIIGVGDGYNDFPLLMACGLKIAMGNASDELKKIADFVAPGVEEDGVATVIEKFVL